MKNVFLGLSLSVVLLLLGSCASTLNVFDDSLAEEEMATIYWSGGVQPVGYNGISIKWKYTFMNWNEIKIPGGNTTFEIEGSSGNSQIAVYHWKGFNFSYNFEKGKEYTIWIPYGSVIIYEGKKTTKKNDQLTTFTPEWN